MWYLKSLKNKNIIHYLLVDEVYTVGRKDARIKIEDDPSISRTHAVIVLHHPEANVNNINKLPIVTIRDVDSKYGTYLNEDARLDTKETTLKISDRITFGQCGNTYEVCRNPMTISTSCISSEEKKSLKQSIQKLGGHLVSEWQTDCTHLVMKEIKVTIKAVCAMVSLKPFVTAEYFEDLLQAIREKKDHPNIKSYVPKLGEPILVNEKISFDPNPHRAKLFENKTFICTSQKQYKKICLGITLASGRVKLLDSKDEVKASLLLHPNTIVMKHQSDSSTVPSPTLPRHVEIIEQELKRQKKRTIPESDIGLAVVYCSTEKYCNPSYNLGSNLFSLANLHSQTLTQGDVYVQATQSTQSSSGVKTRSGSFVEESLERTQLSSIQKSPRRTPVSRKRILETEIKQDPSPKHMKLQEADKPNLTETIASVSTVPISSETEQTTDVKAEDSPIHSPVNSPPHLYTDYNEDKSMENTQVWADVTEEDVMDGFISKPNKNVTTTMPKSSNSHEELPSRLVNVEYAALCPLRNDRRTNINVRDETEPNGTVRNFKKFRKIYSAVSALPRIIGGRDLVAYDKNSSRALDEWLSQNPETEPEKEEDGLFDWEQRPRARRR
ncbi:nibrin-like [Centruroides sculpturatus]|uniref:nibrin-like n=1 Tax=Centruroides sculpturatus TaxID=218467 RepID=UPI000C6E654F|nr:nibrin-like [Centruroides sculpturatus]